MNSAIPSYSQPSTNRQVLLARRPSGIPQPTDFEVVETSLRELGEGELLVRNLYLSADPVQRGWAANPSVTPLGEPMRALAVGIVIESRDPAFLRGNVVYGYLGWQLYHIATAADLMTTIRNPKLPVSLYAGVLGMPGITAYLALMDLAPPKPGDLILVSTAAGAVGSVVGQLARAHGATPIGLTGDDAKVARSEMEFGYAKAINYRTADLPAALNDAAPNGFQTYFDNTGGVILDTAIRNMAPYGRIIQCGTAATASWSPPPTGLRNEREILNRRLSWHGFYIFDHLDRFASAIAILEQMVHDGALHHDEDIETGIEATPSALASLFAGNNKGKKLIFVG